MAREKQIETLKEELLNRKKELLSQVTSSKEIIEELLSETTYDDIDFAEISTDSFNLNILRDKQVQEIREIDLALNKIKNKTYGICEMCDDKISINRLRVKPHARFCVECRPVYEKSLEE